MILAPPRTLVKVGVCVLNHIYIRLFVIIFAIRTIRSLESLGKSLLASLRKI